MTSSIIVVGSLNLDFVARAKRLPASGETVVANEFATFHGGKGANQAYAAARLGAQVAMVGRTGADAHAALLRENLASVGVDTSAVSSDDQAPSGMALITIDAGGQNSIVIVPGANNTLTPDRVNESRALLEQARVVLLQFETPIETTMAAARIAKERGAIVILDPAPARDVPSELLKLADYITPNEMELCLLVGDKANGQVAEQHNAFELAVVRAQALRSRGARNVLVKLGAAGALLVGEDAGEHRWQAVRVEAVDTTAAGDCFNAGFAVGLAEGKTVRLAGDLARAAAALCVMRQGAQAAMPSRREAEELLTRL